MAHMVQAMIETKSAFARRINVHKSQITRAAQAGRLVLNAGGMVEVEASVERWHATKGGRDDVAARHAANRGVAGVSAQPKAESAQNARNGATLPHPAAQPAADQGEAGNRTRYKVMTLHFENQAIKLDMALRRGLRYPLEAVRREALALGATVRAALERIIDQTAPRLAIMTGDLDRRRLLDTELRRLRWMVKSELPRALRRMRADGRRQTQPREDA